MMHGHLNIEAALPTCPRCRLAVEVIYRRTMQLSSNSFVDFFYCKSCETLFRDDRNNWQVENALSAAGYRQPTPEDVELDSYTDVKNCGKTLSEFVRYEAVAAVKTIWGEDLEHISMLCDLRRRIAVFEIQEKERSKDPLHELRRRVAEFKL